MYESLVCQNPHDQIYCFGPPPVAQISFHLGILWTLVRLPIQRSYIIMNTCIHMSIINQLSHVIYHMSLTNISYPRPLGFCHCSFGMYNMSLPQLSQVFYSTYAGYELLGHGQVTCACISASGDTPIRDSFPFCIFASQCYSCISWSIVFSFWFFYLSTDFMCVWYRL